MKHINLLSKQTNDVIEHCRHIYEIDGYPLHWCLSVQFVHCDRLLDQLIETDQIHRDETTQQERKTPLQCPTSL